MGVLLLDKRKKVNKREEKEDTLFSRLQVDGKEETKASVGYRTRSLLGTNSNSKRASNIHKRNRIGSSIQRAKS